MFCGGRIFLNGFVPVIPGGLAPVFSGEYQAGTDAVILSAKYGKTKLAAAKIAASLLFGTAAFILHIVVACGLPLAAFGADGWNLPLQIANTIIPYPLTFLQAVLINIGIIYLVLLAMVGLTLLLSAQMKSPYLVLIILVPILFQDLRNIRLRKGAQNPPRKKNGKQNIEKKDHNTSFHFTHPPRQNFTARKVHRKHMGIILRQRNAAKNHRSSAVPEKMHKNRGRQGLGIFQNQGHKNTHGKNI